MGSVTSGPPPKRQSERRRRNKGVVEVETVDLAQTTTMEVEIPVADEKWHTVAKSWYESLKHSGQALFFEPSDWMTAYMIAESISRDLKPQVIGLTEEGEVKMATIPMKGANLNAYLKAMSVLMVTEGDRRKLRMEIDRRNVQAKTESGQSSASNVTSIEQGRQGRFNRSGS